MTKAQTTVQGKAPGSDSGAAPEEPSGGIFVNYRQCDAREVRRCHAMFVEALSHQLAQQFGEQKVFIDRLTRAGTEYPKELEAKLDGCEVLLVLIHQEWLSDIRERLLMNRKHWVHYEIARVFERKPKAVAIPILLEDAGLPRASDLPREDELPRNDKLPEFVRLLAETRANVRKLVLLQTFRLRSESLPGDLARLVAELETHVRPSWPPLDADRKKPAAPRPASVSAAVGWALGTFTLLLALGYASTNSAPELEWVWLFAVSGFSLVLMATPLSITGIITLSRRRIYKWEKELFAEPSGRYLLFGLIVGLGSILAMLVMLGQPASDAISQGRAIVLVLIFIAVLFSVGIAAVRQDRADREWPPKVSSRPGPLRRAVARSRQSWLLTDHPREALGYCAWVAGTIGLAAGALLALIVRDDATPQIVLVPVLVALIAGGLSLSTMELGFRSQRKLRNWIIEDVRKDLEEQLQPYMPDRPGSADIPDLASVKSGPTLRSQAHLRNGGGDG